MISYVVSLMFFGISNLPPDQEYTVSFADHPRLLFTRQDLPEIRERIENVEWARKVYAGIRRNADAWLDREVVLPDRGSQWWHWYSCKKDGARLQTKSDTEHVCSVCGTVYTGYPYDDVVLASKHGRFADAIWDTGFMYQVTGDARYADKGKEILLAYAEKYLTYPLHNIHGEAKVGGGRVGPQSLDESTWLIRVAQGADMIWDTLTGSEVRKVSEDLFYPAAVDVIQKHRMGIHNIQCWKNSAVGLTGFLLGDKDLVWDAIESDHGYRQQMAQGVRPDGPWFEGAWGYHFYTLSALWSLTEAAYHNGINLYGSELKSMFDAPIDFAMPNLHLPAFNDSGEVKIAGNSLYEVAYARYGEPKYRRVLTHRNSKQAMLYGVVEPGQDVTASQGSRNYTGSGYAILSKGEGIDATWLCVDYGPHGGGHGHPDKLNFVLYAGGEVIAPDPGTAHYGVPIQQEWYRQTIAHNTLTVDEHSQKPAEGRTVAFDAALDAVMLEAGDIYDGVTFYRSAILVTPGLILLIDQAVADAEHTFDFAYHTYGVWTRVPEGAPWTPPDKPGYMHIRDAMSRDISGETQLIAAIDDDRQTSVTILTDRETRLIWGTGIGSNTEDRVPMIIARQKGRKARVIWAISLTRTAPELEFIPLSGTRHALGVRVKHPDKYHDTNAYVWIANPAGETVDFAGQEITEPLTRIPADAQR